MPFTLTHPAVAAPLARHGLILSAVAVGSMAPDFEYYLRLSFDSRWSHTLAAIPVFTLPASLIGLWVFHAWLKVPLLRLLPPAHRQRLAPFSGPFAFGLWRRFVLLTLSCLAGIATHLLFDAFTHEEGFVVQQCPLLHAPAVQMPVYTVTLCEAFQFGLTFLFLAAIGLQYRRWFRQQPGPATFIPTWPELRPLLPWWLGLGAVVLGAALGYAHIAVPHVNDAHDLRAFTGRAILAGLSALVLLLGPLGWAQRRTSPPITTKNDQESP